MSLSFYFLSLEVSGLKLSGIFIIEALTTAANETVVRIGAQQVTVSLAEDAVRIDNGTGALVISGAGVAGRIAGDVTVNITGINADATFLVEINTAPVAVNETFEVLFRRQ